MTASAGPQLQIRLVATAGSTLIELIVALAVLGILLAVSTLALRPDGPPDGDSGLRRAAVARERALASGHPVRDTFSVQGRVGFLLALPDGRVVTDTTLHLDPATGRPRARGE
jgi:prepilin-type N-terminal cleavage/methylation domain-containing protein